MALLAMEQTGFSPRETCLIGDRVYTDIACGVNAGIDTIFVLSGEGVMEDIPKYGVQPTYCMQNIREVLNTLERENRNEAQQQAHHPGRPRVLVHLRVLADV